MDVRFRTTYFRDTGLRNAPAILAKHLKGSLEGIGKNLVRSSQLRMRNDLGNERRSLTIKVNGSGLNLNLLVVSQLMQAFTDAYGLKRGTFPPFGPTSRIYSWALRRATSWEKRTPAPTTNKKVVRKRITKVKKVKKITAPFKQSKISLKGRTKARDSDARRISFLVARAIYEKGIKPSYWNRAALEANMRRIKTDLQNGLYRAVREINRG